MESIDDKLKRYNLVKAELDRNEEKKVEFDRTELSKTGFDNAELSKSELNETESNNIKSNKIEPNRMEPNKIELPPNNSVPHEKSTIPKQEPIFIQLIQKDFTYFLISFVLLGLIRAICLYHGIDGISFPIYLGIQMIVLYLAFNKLNLTWKKSSFLYLIPLMLLGISNFLTDNTFLQNFSRAGTVILYVLLLIHQFYYDKTWSFFVYIENSMRFIAGFFVSLRYPFSHASQTVKQSNFKKSANIKPILIGITISIPLLLTVTTLLISADQMFENIIDGLSGNVTANNIKFIFMVVVGIMWMFLTLYTAASNNLKAVSAYEKKLEPIIAITIIVPIAVVYLLFCSIQVMYLFSNGLFVLPESYTYAEYARQGFFELLAVSIINFLLVVIFTQAFREHKWLNRIMIFVCFCTYIMIASSAYRMMLYVGEYHLTRIRFWVLWFLILLAILISGMIYYIFRRQFALFRFILFTGASMFILLTFSKPDYLIADYNVKHIEDMTFLDLAYLVGELSLDAAPVIVNIDADRIVVPHDVNGCDVIEYYDSEFRYLKEWRDWKEPIEVNTDNLARVMLVDYFALIKKRGTNRSIREYNVSFDIALKTAEKYLREGN